MPPPLPGVLLGQDFSPGVSDTPMLTAMPMDLQPGLKYLPAVLQHRAVT